MQVEACKRNYFVSIKKNALVIFCQNIYNETCRVKASCGLYYKNFMIVMSLASAIKVQSQLWLTKIVAKASRSQPQLAVASLSQPQLAVASRSQPQLAVASRSQPQLALASLSQPQQSRSQPQLALARIVNYDCNLRSKLKHKLCSKLKRNL